jgi:translation initiation factor IF-3
VPLRCPFSVFERRIYELDDRNRVGGLRHRRNLDQRPQEPQTRINEAIRVPQVRLIDQDGTQIGIKATDEAQKYAWGKNLDLVEVAADARPPVCRVMDYSKYRYEQAQKAKLARKHQSTITIKEIKLRPKIDPHDYATKKGHVVRFLKNRDKVKVTIMFRGREMTHPERGRVLLLQLAEDVKDLGIIESQPLQDGRNMVMMLAPHKEKQAQVTPGEDGTASDDADAAAPNGDSATVAEGAQRQAAS